MFLHKVQSRGVFFKKKQQKAIKKVKIIKKIKKKQILCGNFHKMGLSFEICQLNVGAQPHGVTVAQLVLVQLV